MPYNHILEKLPYAAPFLFVDGIHHVDANGIEGYFTFTEEMPFFRGHFKNRPVAPGALLTECCAQIGLVCMGIHLLVESNALSNSSGLSIAFSSSEMEFLLPVYPNEKVVVIATKVYFRFHKLKCSVKMYNEKGGLVCRGILAGMIIPNQHE